NSSFFVYSGKRSRASQPKIMTASSATKSGMRIVPGVNSKYFSLLNPCASGIKKYMPQYDKPLNMNTIQ
ncbi:hypothetical protein LJC15_04915, partial [Desulfovibrio sp. OttesenSCG-928-G11]|nr:hypothetical protein [Desulfovibrio sp. OttesenSCG-928-G11]